MPIFHKKHSNLEKPHIGNFARYEYALVGTNCKNIQEITYKIAQLINQKFEIIAIDAEHQAPDAISEKPIISTFSDKINYHRLDFKALNHFQQRSQFQNYDLALVNGNHFEAKKQIVFIDSKKETSLKKRITQLNNIQAFIFVEENVEIFDFIKELQPDYDSIPQFQFNEIQKIANFIEEDSPKTSLNGLVLAGGKSQRMGEDKGLLNYHGKNQIIHTAELLTPFCENVFVSCRAEQHKNMDLPIITDTFLDLGPFGAILSAFRQNPNVAWLVVACDMPLLDNQTILDLVNGRNQSKTATSFYNPATGFPEPLLTIWEPKSYSILLNSLALGYSCPRKVLINAAIELLEISNTDAFINVNTQEDKKKFLDMTF